VEAPEQRSEHGDELRGQHAGFPSPVRCIRARASVRAINHLREALFDIANDGTVTSKTANSIHEAMHLSALVFSHEVRNGLNRAYVTVARLWQPPASRTDQDTQDTIALARDLQTLIARMNEEAALVG
jgi:hypothetical protein